MKASYPVDTPRLLGSISTPDVAKRTSKLSGSDSLHIVLDRLQDTFVTRTQDFDDCFSFQLLWLKELKEVLVNHDFSGNHLGPLPLTPTQTQRRKEGLASAVRLPLSPNIPGCASGPVKRAAARAGKENGIRQPSFTPPPTRRVSKKGVLHSAVAGCSRVQEATPPPGYGLDARLTTECSVAKPSPLRQSTKRTVRIDTPASDSAVERKQNEQMLRQLKLVQRLYAENEARGPKVAKVASSPKKQTSPRSPKPKMKLKARVLGFKPKSPAGSPLKKTRKHAASMATSTTIGRASLVAADLGTILADTAANVVASNTGGSRPSFGRAYANALERRLQRDSISNTEKVRLAVKREAFLNERSILASPKSSAPRHVETSRAPSSASRMPLSPQEKQRLRAAKRALHLTGDAEEGPFPTGRALSRKEERILSTKVRSEEREVRSDPYANMITPSVIRPQTPRAQSGRACPKKENASKKGRNKRVQMTVPEHQPGPKRAVVMSPKSRRRTLGQESEEETVDLSEMSVALKEEMCERPVGPAVTSSGEWTFNHADAPQDSEGYFDSLSGSEDEDVVACDLPQDSFYVTQTKTPPPRSKPVRRENTESDAVVRRTTKTNQHRNNGGAEPVAAPPKRIRRPRMDTHGPPAHLLSPIKNKRESLMERRSTLRSASFLLSEESIPAALRPEESTPAAVAEVLAASLEGSKRLRQNNSGSFRFNPDELCPSIGTIEVSVADHERLVEEGIGGNPRTPVRLLLSPIKRPELERTAAVLDRRPSPRERRTPVKPISTVLSPEGKRVAQRVKPTEESDEREMRLLVERGRTKPDMPSARDERGAAKKPRVGARPPGSPEPTPHAYPAEFKESAVLIGQDGLPKKPPQSLSELVNRCYQRDPVEASTRACEKERRHLQLGDGVKGPLEHRSGPKIALPSPGELLEVVQVRPEATANCVAATTLVPRTSSEEEDGVKAFKAHVVAPERPGHSPPSKTLNTHAAAIAHAGAARAPTDSAQLRPRKSLVFRGQTEEMLRNQQKSQFVSQQLFGLDKELAEKAAQKLDLPLATQLCLWLWHVAGSDTDPVIKKDQLTFPDCLKSGKLLCAVANKIRPGVVRSVNKRPIPLLERENIKFYLAACQHLGVRSQDLFNISDLYEEKYLPSVVQNINALARAARDSPTFPGPTFSQ